MRCRFCQSTALEPRHRGVSHPKVRDHGPFDLYVCRDCGSLATWPLPAPDALDQLYTAMANGVEPRLRAMREATPLTAWFEYVLKRTARLAGLSRTSRFRWIDAGAGGGELAALLAREFPDATGLAIDWSERPEGLDARVEWQVRDLNRDPLADLPHAELVISLSVWEHVLEPDELVRKLLALVAPKGLLYLVCPDVESLAHRALGTRWPYFIPGEHLHMPSRRGARLCVERVAAPGDAIAVHRVGLPYPPAYVLGYLGLPRLARWARWLPALPLPVGALEAICKRG